MPRFSASAASRASRSNASDTPKDSFTPCVPPIDWNTRSTGAPRCIATMVVVTCDSTQVWVGMSKRSRTESSMRSSAITASTLSVAGFTPITASPAPNSRPSITAAATPRGSSVGWFGCSRIDSRPGRPMVLRKRVATGHFAATCIRSATRMILLTAATISGVRPGASAVTASGAAASSQSRKAPTVRLRTGAKAVASWRSMIRRVISSAS